MRRIPDATGRLFEKFFRADNAVAQEAEGTGLEQSGGRVWCEPEHGRGALFAVALPLQPQGVHR